jgi:hypothetical protein
MHTHTHIHTKVPAKNCALTKKAYSELTSTAVQDMLKADGIPEAMDWLKKVFILILI